jgi:uncharacterized protein
VIALLDVNVLLALFDPSHLNHDAAHSWFGGNNQLGWATCPLTENAFIRIISSPSYPGTRTTVADAAERLREFCTRGDHSFWSDSVSIREGARFRWNRVQGHRQINDAYLLALAVANKGRLATFDSAISIRIVSDAAVENLELIAG